MFRKILLTSMLFWSVYSSKSQDLWKVLDHPNTVYDVDIAQEAPFLVLTAGKDSLGRIWDPNTDLVLPLEGHFTSVSSIDYHEATASILTGSYDHRAILWNLKGEPQVILEGHEEAVVNVWNTSDFLATISRDHSVIIWSRTGEVKLSLKGHTGQVNALVYQSNSDTFYSGSDDGDLRSWGKANQVVASFDSGVRRLLIHGKSNRIVLGLKNGNLAMVQLDNGKVTLSEGHESMITGLAFLDEDRFISCGTDGQIKQWTLDGQLQSTFEAHENYVSGLAVSKGFLVSSGGDRKAKIWRIE
ncbi:MAG: WD40 repeat domain-containing protein [Cytophagales bacterium]|nr:WD40 repeat domain-containing protein [Cytophagales bacterium]